MPEYSIKYCKEQTVCRQAGRSLKKDDRKLIGLLAFSVAVGMLIMLFLRSELVGIFIIALLVFIGYNCYCC